MQFFMSRAGLFSVFASFALLSGAARGAIVEFESSGDLSNFDQRTVGAVSGGAAPAVTSGGLQFTAGSGRSGSGGITHAAGAPTDVSANYTPQSFDLTGGGPFTTSGFFRAPATPPAVSANGAVFQIGFNAASTLAFNGDAGNAFITARILDVNTTDNNYSLQTQVKPTATGTVTATISAADFALTPGDWYRLSVTFTRSATANQFNYSTAFEDWGPTGAALVSTVSAPAPGTVTNADLYNDTSTFAGFRSNEGTPAAFDSFTATGVPEPSSMVAAAGLLAGLSMRRRARRA